MEAEGVGLPVVERLLATCVEKLAVTWSQYYVSFVTFSLLKVTQRHFSAPLGNLQALIFIWNNK
jgi:hypothetical protein